jgi:hypothetical protein
MMTLLTNLTSSLSAAADSSESSLLPSSIGATVHVSQHFVNAAATGFHAKDLPQGLLELGLGGDPIVKLGDTRKHLMEPCASRTASGSRHMITRPSG